jgi:tripartite-type tricarboxylate transporter receptor subunit TctC
MNKTFSRVRRTLISSAIGVLAVVSAGIAAAQDAYPNKPITWVVPFAAGGPTDALARHIADRVARELGPVSYTHLTLPTK